MRLRVGFIGFGTIARGVLGLLEPGDDIEVVGAIVRDPHKRRGPEAPPVCATAEELVALGPEVVVDAGGHAALAAHGPSLLAHGVDLIVLSVGALADASVEQALCQAAREGQARLRIASGGIGALDAIAAAAAGGLEQLTHTVRKPARALLPLEEAAALGAPRELFRGSARVGALKFPESINVAAAVALAGLGLDRTEVCVVADPALVRNTHQVVATGAFGRLQFEIENVPTDNPRTGRIVAMSIVHLLRSQRAIIQIG